MIYGPMRELDGWVDLDAALGQHPRRLEIELALSELVCAARKQGATAAISDLLANNPARSGDAQNNSPNAGLYVIQSPDREDAAK
jgi:hypothetical protein